ncbi:MAG TPA: M14 family zinc carboxypeptidase [Chitinophagaceae bacterium]|nr:M14 family zinc carboxypeptidase [Chitinophagaceae bacterium]
MKKSLFYLILLFFTQFSYAQSEVKEIYYRVYFEANEHLMTQLSQEIMFEHLARIDKGYTGEFSETEKDILLSKATNAKVLIEDVSSFYKKRAEEDLKKTKKTRSGGVPANFHGGTMGGYMTLNQAIQNLDSMVILYPNLVKPAQTIGTTLQGRPIKLYKISDNPSLSEPQEQKVLFTALHHAREPQSLALLVYYMWYVLENYNTSDSVIKHMIDDREMFFIPILNPDGYAYNELTDPTGGGMWRKNRQNNAGGSKGVDLNRNYGFKFAWDNSGSSPNGTSDTYRGASAFSEFETQAVRDLCIANDFKLIMNYHSYGDWIIYPWGYVNQVTPDDLTFNAIADRLTVDNGYVSGTCFQTLAYLTNGGSDDWHYGEQTVKPKTLAMTPEVGSSTDGFWPSPSQIIPLSQANMTQNIMATWLSGPYIERYRNSPYEYNSTSILLNYGYGNYGLDTCLNLKSWFESTSPYFLSSDTFSVNNILSQGNATGGIPVSVSTTTPFGSVISGRVYTKYNNFIFSDTASFRVKSTVGLTATNKAGITISPNPTSNSVVINSAFDINDISISLIDLSGQVVLRKEHMNGNRFQLDISNFANGIYFIELKDGIEISRVKIIKE